MRKYFFLLLMCSSSLMAQDINSDFQAYRKGMLENYSGFRKTILDDYAKYLQGVWEEYDAFRGQKRDDKPKPRSVPKKDDTPVAPQEIPEPTVTPHPTTPIEPVMPKKPTPITPPSLPSSMEFSFYGMNLRAVSCKLHTLNGLDSKDIAKAWERYQRDATMKDVVSSLKMLVDGYGLNDWFTFDLVRLYANNISHNINDRIILRHYLLVNMGYDIRLASDGTSLMLLVPFAQQVYERSYFSIDNKKYYAFFDGQTSESLNGRSVSTCRLPQNVNLGASIDLTFWGTPFGVKSQVEQSFNVSDGNICLKGSVDKGMMEAIRHYPQMDVPYYAMSNIAPDFHQALLEQMAMQIRGLSERDAVSKILHFIQHAFDYATDGEQHGYEKPYFIEENFYYPKNDCEDRAILFAFFVHNLLGLDVHLVDYPGHECTAVNFAQTKINGDGYIYEGKTFYICDPTYIDASIGQCMPIYRDVKPVVEQWY